MVDINKTVDKQPPISASMGGYNSGLRNRAANQNWFPGTGDANADTIYDLPNLRARSRDLARNSPIGCGATNTVVTSVIGTGLTFQANPDSKFLGWTDEQTANWKRLVESEFEMWAGSVDCDASRTNNFYGLQSLALRSMLDSGDVFALTPSIRRDTSPYTLAIQLIEADRVLNKDYQSDTNKKIMGVSLDDNGEVILYDIAKQHPGAYYRKGLDWVQIAPYGKNGRRNVIHLFERRRPGQVRGVPYLSPIIESLKQLSRYSDAELQAAVISAAFAMFIKMDPDAFETLFDGEAQNNYIKNAATWNGNVRMNVDDSGKVVNLLPGEGLEAPNIGRPNANFDPFVLSMLKQIGPALEIPFEVLIKHFSSSYSASRAALLDFWRFVRVRRDFMATYFCEPSKELWFDEAVSIGRIPAPGFFADPAIRRAYTKCMWVGDSPGSIDPEKEVRAAERRIDIGISTREKESVAFDGGDWESNHKQLAKEQKMRDDAGLTTPPMQQPMQQTNN